ncbi:hypothetical protein B0J12DRAFT_736778 [Macrophomina phaseolina]|uniref:BTB domain-containing protein n=1 Tax=Macrophomina phaseolina TaxID=35725 RepID=A0ABQ8GLB5_9PEZI|nr:hypothetical protein B0J12DRAFT_736778 [Macrophomina phaseolina]
MSSHQQQTSRAERIEDVPGLLWASKEWSDLVIVCNGEEEIQAHRAILAEDFGILEGILQHLYGVDVTLLQPHDLTQELSQEDMRKSFLDIVCLYAAADKYAIPELQAKIATVFFGRFQAVMDPELMLSIATCVYRGTPYFDVDLRAAVISHVQTNLEAIVAAEETTKILLENQELAADILRRIAPVLREQTEVLSSGNSSTKTSPTTPKKRKSPRLPDHAPGQYAFRLRLS